MQSSNMLPISLHRVKVLSKNEHRTKVQFTKAASRCTDALNRTPRNTHSSKTPRWLFISVKSESMNSTLVYVCPDGSASSQSRIVDSVFGAARPPLRSAIATPIS